MANIKIDGTRTETIRTVLIAAFAALAVVLLGFLGVQKLKQRGFQLDLPGQLGANISQTANGFTYSQSQRGHTIFTIHASKIEEFKDDQAELHDVSITLYGPEGSHRQDKIAGDDFLYNKRSGVVTARGNVEIDMASPAAAPGGQAGATSPDVIHVQTSGLRFDQKSGEAQTEKALSFTLPRANGKAVGGDYNSKTGVLVLQNAVEMHVDQNGSPSVVYADHAQLSRDSHVAYLLRARIEYEGNRDSADQAILHFRADGSLQHLDAENHVHVLGADGAELYATTAALDLNERSQPLTAQAGGGVNFLSGPPESNMHANAVESTMVFVAGPDGNTMLHHAQFRNAVSFVLQQKSLSGDPRGAATREITASKLDMEFVPGPGAKSLAQKAIAGGGAMVDIHDLPYGAPAKHTTIYGQQLIANLKDGHELQQLDGFGGTKVVDYAPDGATDTSTGDVLHIAFRSIPPAHEPSRTRVQNQQSASENSEIETAVQQGHVSMVAAPARYAKKIDGTPATALYAEAETGTYRTSDQTLQLSGNATHPPRVHNDTLTLTATNVDYRRNSGEAVARGDVRSTYLEKPAQPDTQADKKKAQAPGLGGAGPVHVVGASAEMTRSVNSAVFHGDAQAPARMWQGANSVTAPVLELGKQAGSLNAHGDTPKNASSQAPGLGNARSAVHAAFASKPGQAATGVTRVTADTLFYSDTTRTADFRGGVVAQQPNGVVHADDAQVFLTEAPQGQSSQLDRMIATGHVLLTQPGRQGAGTKLVYTAVDGNYVLTGAAGEPPRATDAQRGATTGAALMFKNGDGSVEVQSNDAEGNNRRTVTDTRSPK